MLGCGAAMVCAVRVMPFTDGWYETLVYLESHGRKAYADLDFPLPPMTLLFYRWLEGMTHGALAANKLIGVGLSAVVAILTGLWLRRHVGTVAAIAAATATLVIETTFPVYIARDYHTLVALFTLATIAAMMATEGHASSRLRLLAAALAGALGWLLFMTKQNVGLVVTAAFIAAQILLTARSLLTGAATMHERLRQLATLPLLAAGVAIGIGVFELVYRSPAGLGELLSGLVSTQSKGSPIYVATRILHDPGNVATIVRAVLLASAAYVVLMVSRFARSELAPHLGQLPALTLPIARVLAFLGAGLVFLDAIVAHREAWTSFDFIAMAAVAGFVYDGLDWLWGQHAARLDTRFLRLSLFASLIFANTMTASINTVGIGLVVAWYVAVGVDLALRLGARLGPAWSSAITSGVGLAVILLFVRLEAGKLLGPYSWWGVAEPPVIASTKAPPSQFLTGLHLNAWRVRAIHAVLSAIKANTRPDEPILTFPNIPLFYRLADRLPPTRTYIQWFDFAREESLRADFAAVAASPPRIVVEMVLPDVVYEGHAKLLGRPPIQRAFADYLQCLVDSKAATLLASSLYSLPGITKGEYVARAVPRLGPNEVRDLMASPFARAEGVRIAHVRVGAEGDWLGASDLMDIDPATAGFSDIELAGPPDAVARVVVHLSNAGPARLSLLGDNAVLRVLRVDGEARSQSTRSQQEPCRSQLMERLDASRTVQETLAR